MFSSAKKTGFVRISSVVCSVTLFIATVSSTPLSPSTVTLDRFVRSVEPAEDIALGVPDEIAQNWGAYTPWKPAGDYVDPPLGCEISQVNLIQRHGARYPTSGAGGEIQSALAKLQNATSYTDSKYDFLKTFVYTLGTADLMPFGATQSYEAGKDAWKRYSAFVKSGGKAPFVRSDDSQRVLDTATNWTAGFSAVSSSSLATTINVILHEAANDTLDNSQCTDAGDSDDQDAEWLAVFAPPITARLNTQAPGANLTDDDTYNLMSMCAFHTLFTESKSPFCDLFEDSEWPDYEYYSDIDKFYGNGYGQALGPVQGVGYINELLARLTDTAVQDHTQTNSTLDSSSTTFPLDRTFYADFSHDNEIISIISAMGLFKQYQLAHESLSTSEPSPLRTWITSKIVPFSGRMVVERLECAKEMYVRVLMNDALQTLEFCGGVPGIGLCRLDKFVESQSYSRNNGEGDWERCFA